MSGTGEAKARGGVRSARCLEGGELDARRFGGACEARCALRSALRSTALTAEALYFNAAARIIHFEIFSYNFFNRFLPR